MKKTKASLSLLSFLSVLFLNSCRKDSQDFTPEKALEYCNMQIQRSINELKINYDYDYTPHSVLNENNFWLCHKVSPLIWTSGFWPGLLWLDYSYTKNNNRLDDALRYTSPLKVLLDQEVPYDHNLGFQIMYSFGNGYKIKENQEYENIIINAARKISLLFSNKTQCFISSPQESLRYNWELSTSIENLASLELLFLATSISKDSSFYNMAISHINNTMNNNYTSGYFVSEIGIYDTLSGNFLERTNIKGYDKSSIWSRGQAWAMYGLIRSFHYTHNYKHLLYAQKTADAFISLLPADYIPYWDLRLPNGFRSHKDASAAAIAASAFCDLSSYSVSRVDKERYKKMALNILSTLSTSDYICTNKSNALLCHSTGNWPLGLEVDVSLIYADYYYYEALIKFRD